MSNSEWKAKLADLVPLYESGAYTASELFWFALPLFDGKAGDRELWDALPQAVKECFIAQMEKDPEMSDPVGAALAEKLSVVRRATQV
jgi:hypothetical protein